MGNATLLDPVMDPNATTPAEKRPLLSSFTESGGLPHWFRAQQRTAWDEFNALPMPARTDQAWRFSSVKALDLSPYHIAPTLSETLRSDILRRSTGLARSAAKLIFGGDQLIERNVLPQELRDRGVIFQPIERALIEHADLVQQYFMTQPATLGSEKFAALHRSFVTSGAFLYVPRGVELEAPIEIFHWLTAENSAVFPHLLLVADEMSKVTVIEHFRSAADKPGFACGVNDLIAKAGANVRYVCVQDWSEQVVSLQMNATSVARDASALSLNVNLGGGYSRFESRSRLVGEGARSDLLALAAPTGQQEFDARTLQDHASPHTTSDLLYKNALADRSRSTFGGLIRVEPHAHFTDAYQTVRNLLLSDDCEANSMPGLEILADNVKCSHGATSGQIHEDELFYLLARGIPLNVAQQLLVAGFLNEVIARLPDAEIGDYLQAVIAKKFARSNLAR